MTFDELLRQVGAHLGIGLKADTDHGCSLVFDGEVEVEIEAPDQKPGQVFLYSNLGYAPSPLPARLARDLLEANYFGAGVGGAILSLDPARGELVIYDRLNLEDLSARDFIASMDNLVDQAKIWTDRVRRGEREGLAVDVPETFALRV